MINQIQILLVSYILLLPWILCSLVIFHNRSVLNRVVLGMVFGIAATVSIGYITAMFGLLDCYKYLYVLILTGSIGGIVKNRFKLKPDPMSQKSSSWLF